MKYTLTGFQIHVAANFLDRIAVGLDLAGLNTDKPVQIVQYLLSRDHVHETQGRAR